MQKSLVVVLSILCSGLVVTNVLTFQAYLKSSQRQTETLEGCAESIRDLKACQAAQSAESIGAKAGLAARDLQNRTQESYQTLNQQAEKTSEQLQKIAGEAMVVINEQAAKSGKDIETATQDLLTTLNQELEKFRESMNKKTSPNP